MMHDYLPIGSVVKLHDLNAPLMIIGYFPVRDDKVAEYLCTCWPAGLFWNRNIAAVNRDQIEEVCYRGFADEAAEKAAEMLEKTYEALAKAGKDLMENSSKEKAETIDISLE